VTANNKNKRGEATFRRKDINGAKGNKRVSR
jgi:hypothetical protein